MLTLIVVALGSVHQELCVLWVSVDCILVVLQSLVHLLQRVEAAAETVIDTVVLFIFIQGLVSFTEFKVFNALVELFGVELAEASSEVTFR